MLSVIPPDAWKIDATIDLDSITLEDVKIVFSQAEKRLDDTVKTGESIASRTISLIPLIAGAFITLTGYLISNWKGFSAATHKDIVAITGAIYLLTLFCYMISNIFPNQHHVLGSEPSELMLSIFFYPPVQPDRTTIFLYLNEIENYDYRIEWNLLVNEKRWKRYRFTVVFLLVAPVILGITFIVLEWVD